MSKRRFFFLMIAVGYLLGYMYAAEAGMNVKRLKVYDLGDLNSSRCELVWDRKTNSKTAVRWQVDTVSRNKTFNTTRRSIQYTDNMRLPCRCLGIGKVAANSVKVYGVNREKKRSRSAGIAFKTVGKERAASACQHVGPLPTDARVDEAKNVKIVIH